MWLSPISEFPRPVQWVTMIHEWYINELVGRSPSSFAKFSAVAPYLVRYNSLSILFEIFRKEFSMTEQLFEQLVKSIIEGSFPQRFTLLFHSLSFLLLAKSCMNLSAIKRSDWSLNFNVNLLFIVYPAKIMYLSQYNRHSLLIKFHLQMYYLWDL